MPFPATTDGAGAGGAGVDGGEGLVTPPGGGAGDDGPLVAYSFIASIVCLLKTRSITTLSLSPKAPPLISEAVLLLFPAAGPASQAVPFSGEGLMLSVSILEDGCTLIHSSIDERSGRSRLSTGMAGC